MVKVEFSKVELDALLLTLSHADVTWVDSALVEKLERAYDEAVQEEVDKIWRE